ncbi:uncharacterized protein RSE6_08923 [Rhynchosporium secalis]|uniref:Uncharacterized protein n=1 Tax=Rhynchosporium secalis TaxID=38038 RepID=A0A1E1MGP1_RHYSE|nr:uncharacterized protein RSE6_08923 [Rhynchosporium secalis]
MEKGECRVAGDCVSGVCDPTVGSHPSTTTRRCVGSGNEGDLCRINFGGSCNPPYRCINDVGGSDIGTCSDN